MNARELRRYLDGSIGTSSTTSKTSQFLKTGGEAMEIAPDLGGDVMDLGLEPDVSRGGTIARRGLCVVFAGLFAVAHDGGLCSERNSESSIGREISITRHLGEGDALSVPLNDLLSHGQHLFTAVWTSQEGGGRPLTNGTGRALSDTSHPLTAERAFNRLSGPDANSCFGCHNAPYGAAGGGGEFVTNVFVLGQRFDFVTAPVQFDGP